MPNLKLPRTVRYVQPQSGRTFSIPRDIARGSLLPGKRISKTGHSYWETRKNRSDLPHKRI